MKAKEMGKTAKWIRRALLATVVVALLYIYGGVSYAQGVGTITASSAKIRSSADTTSTVIASVEKDDKIDITHQTTSADGYTWYKVLDGTNTGYIRADLVEVEGTVPTESAPTTTPAPETVTPEEPPATVVASDVATAKVVSATVNVRANATVNSNLQGSATQDTVLTVSGQAVDSDNMTWYQVSFTEGDKTTNGFVRSDFVEVVDYVVVEEAPAEESVEEAPAEEVVENEDYYLKYTENSAGELDWYLYDTIEGTKQSLTDILEYVKATQQNRANEQAQMQRYKIVAIIMAVVIFVLIIVITILIFKLKDIEYVDDEEEEDEEDYEDEEEEEVIVRPTVKKSTVTQQKPVQQKPVQQKPVQQKQTLQKEVMEETVKPEVAKARKVEDRQWQTKNFLDVDDEMEFEFLDL